MTGGRGTALCALAAERCADRACSSSVSSRWRGSRLPETAEAGPAADPEGAADEHDRSSDCRASRALSLDPARGPRQLATASGEKTKAAEAGDDAGGGGCSSRGGGSGGEGESGEVATTKRSQPASKAASSSSLSRPRWRRRRPWPLLFAAVAAAPLLPATAPSSPSASSF